MKQIHLILIILIFSCSNSSKTKQTETINQSDASISIDSTDFGCKLTASRTVYELGELPDLTVEISNFSNSEVYLIGSLDASEERWRMPYCYYTIEKPKIDSVPPTGRCGNMNTLRPKDFVLVRPNETFNPYKDIDGFGFFDSYEINRPENFRNKGIYKIQFHYSTKSDTLENYLGDSYKANKDRLRRLFEKVPKIELSSNIVEIQIK